MNRAGETQQTLERKTHLKNELINALRFVHIGGEGHLISFERFLNELYSPEFSEIKDDFLIRLEAINKKDVSWKVKNEKQRLALYRFILKSRKLIGYLHEDEVTTLSLSGPVLVLVQRSIIKLSAVL